MSGEVKQWIASIACSLCVATAGGLFVWMAPLMVILISPGSPINMTTTDSSWISSFIETGEVISTIPAGLLADKYGRKIILLTTGPLTLITSAVIIFTRSKIYLYVVRFIQGIVVAIAFTLAPIYLAEIAEPKIRGKLSGLFQTLLQFGTFYAFATGPYLSYNNYAHVGAILPIVFMATYSLVPESPYYLLMINEENKARKALAWLRNGNIAVEFNEMKKAVEVDMKNNASWRDLFATKKDIKAFFLVQLICLVRYLNGAQPILIYATQMFTDQEFDIGIPGYEMTVIVMFILVITTFVFSLFTDRAGRRSLLIISTSGSGIFNFIIALICYLDYHTAVDVSSYKWINYVSVIGFFVISNVGLGPLMQTVKAEYFPSHTRGIGGGITEMVASFAVFISIKQYQVVNDYFGIYMNYVVFTIISFIGTVLIAIMIPETSGKSLGQIQECLGGKKPEKY